MSTDQSTAMERIDAAVEDSARKSATAPSGELADLATAIDRIESLIAGGAVQGPDGPAVAEQIADIASALQDHEVEASLSGALGVAVREINDDGALKQASEQRTHQVAELLRQLSRRVSDMVAQSHRDQGSKPSLGADTALTSRRAGRAVLDEGDGDDEAARDDLLKTDTPEDDEFAQVVAALTAALPSLAEFSAPSAEPLSGTAEDEIGAVLPRSESAAETVIVAESLSSALLDQLAPPPAEETSNEDFLHDAQSNETRAPTDVASTTPPELPRDLVGLPVPNAPAESHHRDSAESTADLVEQLGQEREAELRAADEQAVTDKADPPPPHEDVSSLGLLPLIGPDEDPGDLFEASAPAPSSAPASNPKHSGGQFDESALKPEPLESPAPIESVPLDIDPPVPPSLPPTQPSQVAATTPAQSVPRLAPNDPLGPVRGLSEDELIALFS
jgi:hypothetical protein